MTRRRGPGPSRRQKSRWLKVCSGCSNPVLMHRGQRNLAGRRHCVRCVDLLGADGDQTYHDWQQARYASDGQQTGPDEVLSAPAARTASVCSKSGAITRINSASAQHSNSRYQRLCDQLLRSVFEPARGEHRDQALRRTVPPSDRCRRHHPVPTAQPQWSSPDTGGGGGSSATSAPHASAPSGTGQIAVSGSPPGHPTGSQGQRPPR